VLKNFTERTEPSTSALTGPKVVKELCKSEGDEPSTSMKASPMRNDQRAEIRVSNNVSFHVVLSDADALRLSELQKSMPVQAVGRPIIRKYNLKKSRDEDRTMPAEKNKSPSSSSKSNASPSVCVEEQMELIFNSDSSGTSSPPRQLERRGAVDERVTSCVKVLPAEKNKSPSSSLRSNVSPSVCVGEQMELIFNSDSSNTSSPPRQLERCSAVAEGVTACVKVLPEKIEEGTERQSFKKPSSASAKLTSSLLSESSKCKQGKASQSKDNLRIYDAAVINKDDTQAIDGNVPLDKDNNLKTGVDLTCEGDVPIDNSTEPVHDALANAGGIPAINPHHEADVTDDEDEVTFQANLTNKSKMNALHAVLGETSTALQVELPGQAGPSAEQVGSIDETAARVVKSKKRRFVNTNEPQGKGIKKKRFASLSDSIASASPIPDQSRRSARPPQTRFYVEGK
jgi:hypothetical protein